MPRLKKDVATRFLGVCQYCAKQFKLSEGARPGTYALVLHGYERPGTGNVHGQCPGVGHAPWEATCEDTKRWLAAERDRKAGFEKSLANVESASFSAAIYMEPKTHRGKRTEGRWVQRGEYEWEGLRRREVLSLENSIWYLKDTMRMHEALILAWHAPKPVRSLEEETQEVSAKRASNKQARTTAKEQKLAQKIAYYQRAIDSLVRRAAASIKKFERDSKAGKHTPEFEGNNARFAPPYEETYKLVSLADDLWSRSLQAFGYVNEDALDLMDRLPVWQAVGLYGADGAPITVLSQSGRRRELAHAEFAWASQSKNAEQVEGLRRLIGMPSHPASGQSTGIRSTRGARRF